MSKEEYFPPGYERVVRWMIDESVTGDAPSEDDEGEEWKDGRPPQWDSFDV